MSKNYLTEAFKELDLLESQSFDVDKKGTSELEDFLEDDSLDDFEVVIDPEAETEEDLQKSYMGKAILMCDVCHSMIYKDPAEIVIDEESQLANVGELCPYCFTGDGYKVVGKVAPYEEVTVEAEKPVEVKVDGEEVEVEDKINEKIQQYQKFPVDHKKAPVMEGKKRLKEFRIVEASSSNTKRFTLDMLHNTLLDPQWSDDVKSMKDNIKRGNKLYLEGDIQTVLDGLSQEGTLTIPRRFARDPENVDEDEAYAYFDYLLDKYKLSDVVTKWLSVDVGLDEEIQQDQKFPVEHKKAPVMEGMEIDNLKPDQEKEIKNIFSSLKKGKNKISKKDLRLLGKNNSSGTGLINQFSDNQLKDLCKKFGYILMESIKEDWDDEEEDEEIGYCVLVDGGSPSTFSNKEEAIKKSKELIKNKSNAGKFIYIYKGNLNSESYPGWDDYDEFDGEWEEILKLEAPEDFNLNIFDQYAKEHKPEKDLDFKDLPYEILDDMSSSGSLTIPSRYAEDPENIDEDEAYAYFNDLIKKYNLVDRVKQFLKRDEPLKESMDDISITTEDQVIKIKSTPREDKETIQPVTETEVEKAKEVEEDIPVEEVETQEEVVEEEPEEVDVDLDEIDEEGMDDLGESYLKSVYENVNGFKTSKAVLQGNKMILEGVISFTSGNKAKTKFIFESKEATKRGKLKFLGENKNISKNKKAFTLIGSLNNKKLMLESLNYNYTGKDSKTGKTKRLYGTIRRKSK